MASTYHTVSDEMSWTDWSSPEDVAKKVDGVGRKSRVGVVAALICAIAMLGGVIFLLPPGTY
jgi:hypothetical protein